MDYISKKSNFSQETDFHKIYQGNDTIAALDAIKGTNNFTYSDIILLCTGKYHLILSRLNLKVLSFDCKGNKDKYTYWLLYNQSLVHQNFVDNMNAPMVYSYSAIETARTVELAITNYILESKKISIPHEIEHNFTIQNFPQVKGRFFNHYDTASEQGATWYYIPIMISSLLFCSELLKEKEENLRKGLTLLGTGTLHHYLSWFIFMFIFDNIFTVLLIGMNWAIGIEFFINTPFIILHLVFLSGLFSSHCMLFLIVIVSCFNSRL